MRKKLSLYRSIPKPLQIGVTDQDLSQAYLYNPRYSKAMGIKITPLPEGSVRRKGAAPNEKEKASLMRHIAQIKDIVLNNHYKHIVNNYQPEKIP